jgi:tRNA pseudouridine38-40 synthase
VRPAKRESPRARERAIGGPTLRAKIEYDGTRYRGWQSQVNARTVQGVLYEAVREVLGEETRIFGAGRTDAGVHAFGQVASLHLKKPLQGSLGAARRALNDSLPADVNVLDLQEAPRGFHARHDALLRIYRYRIARRRTAFGKPFVYWVKDRLDAEAMERAAQLFLGRRDFAGFCDNPDGHDSTLVEVSYARVFSPQEAPDLVLFRVAASHFLWKMVRRLVGVLIEVGTGRLDAEGVERLFAARSPRVAEWTAPAAGLFLEAVAYPGDPQLEEIDPLRPAF